MTENRKGMPGTSRLISTRRVIKVLAVATALLGMARPAFAGEKVVAVDFEKVVKQSPQYKTGSTKATAEFQKRESDFDERVRQLQDDVQKYSANRSTLSEDASEKAAKELDQRRSELQADQQKLEQDATLRNKELTHQLIGLIGTVVAQLAKEKEYDMVVINTAYASPETDISDEVLKRMSALPVDSK